MRFTKEIITSTLCCSIAGLVIAVAISLVEVLDGWNDQFHQVMSDLSLMSELAVDVSSMLYWILVLLMTSVVSLVVLGSENHWQRLVVLMMSLVFLSLISPIMASLDMKWPPLEAIFGVTWSWGCSFIYSIQRDHSSATSARESSSIQDSDSCPD